MQTNKQILANVGADVLIIHIINNMKQIYPIHTITEFTTDHNHVFQQINKGVRNPHYTYQKESKLSKLRNKQKSTHQLK